MATFEDCFDKVFEKNRLESLEKKIPFVVRPETAKILMFMWNMIAEAKGQCDDIVSLNEYLDIVSFPVNKIEEKANKSGTKKTAKPKKDKAVINEQEEESEPKTTE